MDHYAGVDFGATHIRAAVADAEGCVLATAAGETPPGPDDSDVTDAVLDRLRAACADAGIGPMDVRGVGVGSIGPIDMEAGAVAAVNLPDVDGPIRLRDPIAGLVDAPVRLQNDAVAGVVGERVYGGAPDDTVYLTISTGIGAGAVVDGHVLGGWDGNAAEVGHLVVDPGGRMSCGCGGEGHWEAYCSGANLPRYARALHGDDPVDTDLPIDGDLTAPDLFDHPDDPLAARVVDRTATWNAIGVTDLVHAFAPRLVAVGGAVALSNPGLVIDPIRERVPDLVTTNAPEIRATALGEEVVLRGALAGAIAAGEGRPPDGVPTRP